MQAAEVDSTLKFERHWQTQRLVDAYAAMKPGERISLEDLAAQCEISPESLQKRVQSAKRAALHEHNAIIMTIRKFGFERLPQTAADIPAGKYLSGARNKARRAAAVFKHGITDWHKIERTKKNEMFATQAQCAAIVQVTTVGAKRKLTTASESANSVLDFGKTIQVLGGK